MSHTYRIYMDGSVYHKDEFPDLAEDKGDFYTIEIPDAVYGHIAERILADLSLEPMDSMVAKIESRGLTWDVGTIPGMYECRILHWPYVIGRYRGGKGETVATLLAKAIQSIPCGLEGYDVVEEKNAGL